MRKLKINVEQVQDAIAFHMDSLNMIHSDEHISFTPLQIKEGMMTIYVHKNKDE